MKAELQELARRVPFELVEVPVDRTEALHAGYWERIPYLFIGGRPHAKYRLQPARFIARLHASRLGFGNRSLPAAVAEALTAPT